MLNSSSPYNFFHLSLLILFFINLLMYHRLYFKTEVNFSKDIKKYLSLSEKGLFKLYFQKRLSIKKRVCMKDKGKILTALI